MRRSARFTRGQTTATTNGQAAHAGDRDDAGSNDMETIDIRPETITAPDGRASASAAAPESAGSVDSARSACRRRRAATGARRIAVISDASGASSCCSRRDSATNSPNKAVTPVGGRAEDNWRPAA